MTALRKHMEEFLADWRNDLALPWRSLLDGVEPDFDGIDENLEAGEDEVVFPGRKGMEPAGAVPGSHVFKALDGIAPEDVRVVVIGQDPYPRVSRASGRAFEQGDLVDWNASTPKIAPSLKRILQQIAGSRTNNPDYTKTSGGWKQLRDDLKSGVLNLEPPNEMFDGWQSQGVLWLNTGLTLTRYKPGGHPHQLDGHIPLWATVVGALCRRLAAGGGTPVIFIAWGSKARRFLYDQDIISSASRPFEVSNDLENLDVVDRNHPAVSSFLSGENVFDETNRKLVALGVDPVEW